MVESDVAKGVYGISCISRKNNMKSENSALRSKEGTGNKTVMKGKELYDVCRPKAD